ncbi:MAG TPA: hypothetical protein VI136_10630 [Verrucomicrobiae bacterium]
MAEDYGNRQQSRSPALIVKMMLEVFPVIVWLLMLPHQASRQRPAAPLAAVRLRVHSGESALKVSFAHVMPARQVAVRQQPAVAEIVAGLCPPAFHHLEQRAVSSRAEVAACFCQRHGQSGHRLFGFNSVVTHSFSFRFGLVQLLLAAPRAAQVMSGNDVAIEKVGAIAQARAR